MRGYNQALRLILLIGTKADGMLTDRKIAQLVSAQASLNQYPGSGGVE